MDVIKDLDDQGVWCPSCETRLRIGTMPVQRLEFALVQDDR